jgi:hypothetical protein
MFADMHQLQQHVQFNTQVLQATPLPAGEGNSRAMTNGSSSSSSSSSTANGSSSSSSSTAMQWQVQSVRLGPDGQAEQQPQQQVSWPWLQ